MPKVKGATYDWRAYGALWRFAITTLLVLSMLLAIGYVQTQRDRQLTRGNALDMAATAETHGFGVDHSALSKLNAHGTVDAAMRIWLMKASADFNIEKGWTYAGSFYGGLYLLLRTTLPWMALILPLLGFAAAIRWVGIHRRSSGKSPRSFEAVAQGVLLGASQIVILLALLAIAACSLQMQTDAQVWIRVILFGLAASGYTAACFYLGVLVCRCTPTRSASWLASAWVAVLVLSAVANLATVIPDRAFGELPQPSSAFRRAPYRSEERRALETAYFDEVATYAEITHQTVVGQYQLERWLHLISPLLLFEEIGSQLLQDRFPNATDALYSSRSLQSNGSLAASLAAAWPEWLGLIVATGGFGMLLSRREPKRGTR